MGARAAARPARRPQIWPDAGANWAQVCLSQTGQRRAACRQFEAPCWVQKISPPLGRGVCGGWSLSRRPCHAQPILIAKFPSLVFWQIPRQGLAAFLFLLKIKITFAHSWRPSSRAPMHDYDESAARRRGNCVVRASKLCAWPRTLVARPTLGRGPKVAGRTTIQLARAALAQPDLSGGGGEFQFRSARLGAARPATWRLAHACTRLGRRHALARPLRSSALRRQPNWMNIKCF